ncbi:MAG TPA: UDP-N-acetylglucosamine 2-epimerase, partial [Solirubrobacteraceae bacterium]
MAPVIRALREQAPSLRQVIVHTGQHYDREMADIFVEELGLPEPDHMLGVGSGAHGAQTGRALERIEEVLLHEEPDAVL